MLWGIGPGGPITGIGPGMGPITGGPIIGIPWPGTAGLVGPNERVIELYIDVYIKEQFK